MGANFGGGTFYSDNWKKGIRLIQEEDEERYGCSYSGASNCCNFSYDGDKSKLTKKEFEKYEERMAENLATGQGVVVSMGISHYEIWSTEMNEIDCGPKLRTEYFNNREKSSLRKSTALLVDANDHIISSGNVSEMKKKAQKYLNDNPYKSRCYVISKSSKCYCFKSIKKEVKKTTRESTSTIRVIPIKKYVYMGWFRE